MIKLKRAYQPAARGDGVRILVERLWPRGVSKSKAKLDVWLKDIAPSSKLRKWFGHDPEKWKEFQKRYRAELKQHSEPLDDLRSKARKQTITLVYGSKDEENNAAVVLRDLLESK